MSNNIAPLYKTTSAPTTATDVYTATSPVHVWSARAHNTTGSAITVDITVGGVNSYKGFSIPDSTEGTPLGNLSNDILQSGETINVNASAADLHIRIVGQTY